jgi:hypothetical protein
MVHAYVATEQDIGSELQVSGTALDGECMLYVVETACSICVGRYVSDASCMHGTNVCRHSNMGTCVMRFVQVQCRLNHFTSILLNPMQGLKHHCPPSIVSLSTQSSTVGRSICSRLTRGVQELRTC